MDVFENDQLVQRALDLAPHFEEAIHSLTGLKYVSDIHNYGLAGALTIKSYPKEPARRPYEIAMKAWDLVFYVRYGGDAIQLEPNFVSEKKILLV